MDLREKIAIEIYKEEHGSSMQHWTEDTDKYMSIAYRILDLPEFEKLMMWDELVEALNGASKLATADFDEAVNILSKIRNVLVKAKGMSNEK